MPFSSKALETSLKNLPKVSLLRVGYRRSSSRMASSLRLRWMLKTKACLYYLCRYSSFTIFWTIGTLAFTSACWYILSSFYM